MRPSQIEAFLAAEQLPAAYANIMTRFHHHIAAWIARCQRGSGRCLTIGINGAQGTGKTTTARSLALYLQHSHQLATVTLSLDDFYLGREARNRLATEQHPLLTTRGVPGTHDVPLALQTLSALRQVSKHRPLRLPRFDKSTDDRLPAQAGPLISQAPSVIILEGWCVGLSPQDDAALAQPINQLERSADPDARWRRYVNRQLAGDYQQLFAQLDRLIMLRAPSFECILQWRALQESKLAARVGSDSAAPGLMDKTQLCRFIEHFERLTRHGLRTLPESADLLLELDEQQQIRSCRPDPESLSSASPRWGEQHAH